jgi:predicted regulator of amino acid metabolism with ACT domain
MLTIGKITEDIINRSPFLREAITEDLINISALARKIKPEIDEYLKKDVKEGAIVMAIKRMSPGSYHKINMKIRNFMNELGDFLVRSDLEDYTFQNTDTLKSKQVELMKRLASENNAFFTVCQGVTETTYISSKEAKPLFKELFADENLRAHIPNLASVTIKLPTTNKDISGIYYFMLKHIAWEGINIVEIVSTANEFSIIVDTDDIDLTFSVLMRLKKGM